MRKDQSLFERCGLKEDPEKRNRVLGKDIQNCQQNLPKNPCLIDNNAQKNDEKFFRATRRSNELFLGEQTRNHLVRVMRVSYCKREKN